MCDVVTVCPSLTARLECTNAIHIEKGIIPIKMPVNTYSKTVDAVLRNKNLNFLCLFLSQFEYIRWTILNPFTSRGRWSANGARAIRVYTFIYLLYYNHCQDTCTKA